MYKGKYSHMLLGMLLLVLSGILSVGISTPVLAQDNSVCANSNFEPGPSYVLDFSEITTESLGDYVRIQDGQDFNHWAAGWNSEKQLYTTNPANVRVENDNLVIQALVEQNIDHDVVFNITSARVDTIGFFSAMYGCFTTHAKIAEGTGTWSAFWLLPEGGAQNIFPLMTAEEDALETRWQAGGELDVFESLGSDVRPEFSANEGVLSSAVHSFSSLNAHIHNSGIQRVENLYGEYHDFTMQWLPTEVTFLIDDIVIYQFEKTSDDWREWPFGPIDGQDRPFYAIWNLAMGGGWNDDILAAQNRSFPDGIDVSQADKWLYQIAWFEHYEYVGDS